MCGGLVDLVCMMFHHVLGRDAESADQIRACMFVYGVLSLPAVMAWLSGVRR